MVPKDKLKSLLANPEYSRGERILLCLGVDADAPKRVRELRKVSVDAGVRGAKKWNISQILSDQGELAVRVPEGWELTAAGRKRVAELAGTDLGTRTASVAAGLRHHISQIGSEETKSFVVEAIECLEYGMFRAATVLTWVGAVSVLHEVVTDQHLAAFNAEAKRRDTRWVEAKTTDDLSRMKEWDFLQILERISVIGKSVKQELEGCLRLRNGCGHPNSLVVGEARVAAHVETLLTNVFARFTS